jgi:hypothetical protein
MDVKDILIVMIKKIDVLIFSIFYNRVNIDHERFNFIIDRMPWQGQTDNMIDRFDVRAHLDFMPQTKIVAPPT